MTDPTARAIVASIVAIAHAMSACVIAEGIETVDALDFFVRRDVMRGWHPEAASAAFRAICWDARRPNPGTIPTSNTTARSCAERTTSRSRTNPPGGWKRGPRIAACRSWQSRTGKRFRDAPFKLEGRPDAGDREVVKAERLGGRLAPVGGVEDPGENLLADLAERAVPPTIVPALTSMFSRIRAEQRGVCRNLDDRRDR